MSDAPWTSALLGTIGMALSAADAPAASRESEAGLDHRALSSIERAIASREYEASPSEHGLQAPNRAHDLRTWFEPTGIRVHDRTAEGSPELLGLSLSSLGRGTESVPLAPGAVTSQGARVEIRRPGLLEWYVNSPEGLEQGFTLETRPAGEAPLVLELALRGATGSAQGDGLVFATAGGRRLAYSKLIVLDASARKLAAQLVAPSPDRVRIVVEDAGAAYPLVIDPLLTETADAQVESNDSTAQLGTSVASAGDVNGDGYADVIVGAPYYDGGGSLEGAAFIFLGSASGVATGGPSVAATQLEANQSSARFGISVAGIGDVNGDGYGDVIVGAAEYDADQTNEGAAFIFHGSASGIPSGGPATAATRLESNQSTSPSPAFGNSVAGAGDVNGDGYADVIVGAYLYDAGTTDEGAAFIFHGSAAGIPNGHPSTAASLLESNTASVGFGWSVASAGDVNGDGRADVIVSAFSYASGQALEGAAFVFHGSASGVPSGNLATAAAQIQGNQIQAQLGSDVASAGDVNGDGYADIIVGASAYNAGQTDEGAAFIFHGSASGIASGDPATAATQLESNEANGAFGASVASAGDVNGDGYADVIVGDFFYGASSEGAAFVFFGGASGIPDGNPTTAAAELGTGQGGANLGADVASAGDVNGDGYADVIVGATLFDSGESSEGAAFVYHGGAQGILDGNPTNAPARLETNQANAAADPVSPFYFDGLDATGAGDVNGDGYSDVIIGAPYYDSGQTDEGAAFIFLGSASGVANGNPTTAATVLQSNLGNAQLGRSVAGAGDVNGDGYADVIVGAWQYNAGQPNEGAAFVFLGSATGIASGSPATAAAQLESDQADAKLGESVAGAGDTNGDGYADVIVGARYFNAGQSDEGAAFLFLGSAAGVASGSPATAAAQLESEQADALLGFVASAGDVNGDGYADVVVGATQYDSPDSNEGAAFVFLGSAAGISDGTPASAAAQLEANLADAQLGMVSGAGDVNADGYADLIVGAPNYDAGQGLGEGAAFVFLGSASGIPDGNPATATAQLESNQASALFGFRVAGAGDVDGDGFSDVLVSSIAYDAGQTNEGAAFIFLGSAAGIVDGTPATAAAQLESNQTAINPDPISLGWSAASAGDVNGDGFGDVIVGTPYYDSGQTDEGVAFVFYGGGNRTGRPVLARQLRGGGGTLPVQPWGGSYDSDDFQVRARATHPQGRGRVKLQVQACRDGFPFGHASCANVVSPSWTDVTATSGGVTLTQTASGLADGTLYHWRARVLHAPFGVTQAGITAPPNPAHGPWRRLFGQALAADVRTLDDGDDDNDDDGLLDIYETDTGSYVSPTNSGTDPNDSDSDDDGLLDGAEVALGTNPNLADHDGDGDLDGADNCPFVLNADQANGDSLPAGNACQCGNVDATGGITVADYTLARTAVVKPTGPPFDAAFCDVNDDSSCDVEDLAILQRIVNAQPASVLNGCTAYGAP